MADEEQEKPEETPAAEEPKAEAAPAAAEEKPAEEKPAEQAEAAPAAGAAPEPEGEKKKERTAADVLLELDGDDDPANQKVLKAKGSKNILSGIVHVKCTFNNTAITITDARGNTIGWSTSGDRKSVV